MRTSRCIQFQSRESRISLLQTSCSGLHTDSPPGNLSSQPLPRDAYLKSWPNSPSTLAFLRPPSPPRFQGDKRSPSPHIDRAAVAAAFNAGDIPTKIEKSNRFFSYANQQQLAQKTWKSMEESATSEGSQSGYVLV